MRADGDAWTVSDVPLLDEWERKAEAEYAAGVLDILKTDREDLTRDRRVCTLVTNYPAGMSLDALARHPVALVEFPADDPEQALRFWVGVLGVDLQQRQAGEGAGWQTAQPQHPTH